VPSPVPLAKSENLETNKSAELASNTNAPAMAEAKPAAPAPVKPKVDVIWKAGDHIILSRNPATGDVRFWNYDATPGGGFMTVVPMVFGSTLCMILFSLLTSPPSRATIAKYFEEPADSSRRPVPSPANKI
jgi:hypothetical protein